MTRMVRHDAKGPIEVKEAGSWVCQCGLSKEKPMCDGSHNRTKDEEDGKVYCYGDENRVEAKNEY